MKSYADVTNFISQAIDELSLTEHIRFLQNLIYQFVRDLPIDWLDNELDSEKPHYQAIFDQIIHQSWQKSVIENQLNELDTIMFDMGDAYPHNTSEAILLILDMLGFYQSLIATEEKSALSNGWVILSTESYLDYHDKLAEGSANQLENDGEQSYDEGISFDNWLAHPLTQSAFQRITHALKSAKNK